LLEALCKINEGVLKTRKIPPLYESGVKYIRENGTEEWLDILHVLDEGGGDCEDLSCWRVAELRHAGLRSKPFAKWRRVDGIYHYHIQVVRYGSDGTPYIEDPSHHLGMEAGTEFSKVDERFV
jgi:hypothetical protein